MTGLSHPLSFFVSALFLSVQLFEDNLDQDTTVSVLLMDHADNEVKKLSVCPSTGNVAVCSRAKIAVHQVELVNEFPVV